MTALVSTPPDHSAEFRHTPGWTTVIDRRTAREKHEDGMNAPERIARGLQPRPILEDEVPW